MPMLTTLYLFFGASLPGNSPAVVRSSLVADEQRAEEEHGGDDQGVEVEVPAREDHGPGIQQRVELWDLGEQETQAADHRRREHE
ncbi:hypothetical protein [Pseudonocardia xinjiangensis]|uniref:hypothetical protein n=1 Tax=Pseudonocardia xinjiangensis TaxID=75289 RepID=UPI001B7D1C2A|nr:hypothetical protein [Pseudonocardia xinjiangensis]